MMTLRSLRLAALAPVLAALACSTSTTPNGPVAAQATAQGIRATNRTSQPIFFTTVERNAAALYDFAMCSDPERCETIAPGASHTVPWSQVASYSPNRHEYLVLWWHGEDVGSGGATHSVVVVR